MNKPTVEVEFVLNGSVVLELRPKEPPEIALLDAMAESSKLDKKVRVTKEREGCYRIAVERVEKKEVSS
jgi:hypothetical protein